MQKTFVIIDGDPRQKAAGEYLQRMGYRITEQTAQADYILLPLPLDEEKIGLSGLLQEAKPGAVALGGRVSAHAQELARAAGVPLLDYFEREDLIRLNAVPTAEGCIAILLQERRRTLWHSRVLVLGYGRVAKALTRRLLALDASVTVAARSAAQRAEAQTEGCEVLPLSSLAEQAHRFDTAVNTIPAPVLTADILQQLAPDALVVDLASRPGGTDFEAAQAAGVRAILAPGLPGKCAPVTAGEFVAQTVLELLEERGEFGDGE